MKKLDIFNNISRTFHNVGFQVKKHSPEILIVTGVIGTVASAIMACKATTKVNDVLTETKRQIDVVHEGVENGEVETLNENGTVEVVPYSHEDAKKDLAYVYAKTGVKFVKLYGPSVVLGALSLTSIVASNNILRTRNAALAAAYATEQTLFKDYRGRVVERFGKDLDRELRYNIKAREIEEVVMNEDGTESVVKKTVEVGEVHEPSDFARFFDDGCKGWEKNAEYNLLFLKQTQNHANDKLRAQGHLTINEVYEMLGIQKTEAGSVFGWVYDESNPDLQNHVDFGIYDMYVENNEQNAKQNERKRAFVNGLERTILLDFNIDGNVWKLKH